MSGMMLKIHSDSSCFSVNESISIEGGHYYLGDNYNYNSNKPCQASIDKECSIIKSVLDCAAQTEITSIFVKSQKGFMFRVTLIELGHPQPAILLRADGIIAEYFINKKL